MSEDQETHEMFNIGHNYRFDENYLNYIDYHGGSEFYEQMMDDFYDNYFPKFSYHNIKYSLSKTPSLLNSNLTTPVYKSEQTLYHTENDDTRSDNTRSDDTKSIPPVPILGKASESSSSKFISPLSPISQLPSMINDSSLVKIIPPVPILGKHKILPPMSLMERKKHDKIRQSTPKNNYHSISINIEQFIDYTNGFDFSEFEKRVIRYIADFISYYRSHSMKCNFQYCLVFNKPSFKNLANAKNWITKNWVFNEVSFMLALSALIWVLDLNDILLPNKFISLDNLKQLRELYELHAEPVSETMKTLINMKKDNNNSLTQCRRLLSKIPSQNLDNKETNLFNISFNNKETNLLDMALNNKIGKFPPSFVKFLINNGIVTMNNIALPISNSVLIYSHEMPSLDKKSKIIFIDKDHSDDRNIYYNIKYYSFDVLNCVFIIPWDSIFAFQ